MKSKLLPVWREQNDIFSTQSETFHLERSDALTGFHLSIIRSDSRYLNWKYEAPENAEEHGLRFDIQLQNIYREMEWCVF